MRIFLALLIVLLLATPAFARPVTKLACDPPTSYDNGDPLAPGETDGFKFICGAASGVYTTEFFSTTCSASLVDIAAGEGENYCVVKAVTWGIEGHPTNEVQFRKSGTSFFAPPPPGVAANGGTLRLE